jgi:hypothetical protein
MTITEPRMAEPVRQNGTHDKLVSRTEQRKINTGLTLDAIVVPASRSAENLETAITLARAARSELLILCSHLATPAEVNRVLAQRSFSRAIVIELPNNYGHELLDFNALASIESELPAACSYYTTNLSAKRNVGLLLARMVGWRRIFFLDDDIRDIGYPDLQSTVSMLARYQTAGMRVTEFPDNSAACHAHRATRGAQDVFLSGAALAVDMQQDIGFFPNIYNEDWLFFYDDVADGQIGSSARRITQLRYDPFADPRRAAWQEFGDIIAEGLYALLDRGLGLKHSTHEYWSDFLHARHTFLKAILRRSGTVEWEKREQLLLSVKAALQCSMTIEPGTIERYLQAWRQDLRDWQQRVGEITQTYPIEVALKELGLERSAYGWAASAAHLRPDAVSKGPPTMPYELSDLFELLGRGAIEDDEPAPNPEERYGADSTQAGLHVHRGSFGVPQSTFATARLRFRKSRHEHGQREPGRA